MKVTHIAVFSLAFLAATFALPANLDRSEEVEFIPMEETEGRPVVATGMGGPFDGLLDSFASIMARMRQQMDYILRRLPFANGTVEDMAIPGFPDLDLSKGNTTSVTKVIDGHKVVINETEYKREGDLGSAFFKVKIIDVLPDSSELDTKKIAASPKDTESMENSFENEIPKNREIEVDNNLETLDEPDSAIRKISNRRAKWANLETFDSFEDNSIKSSYSPRDLSGDIYINKLMADAGVPVNPDAEVFSSGEYNFPYMTNRRQPFERMMYPR